MAPIGANFAVERLGDRSQEVAVTDQERDQENETDSADELTALRGQVLELEDELASLVRRLQDAPKRVRTLEERLLETKGQLAQAVSQNEKLSYTLREARDHIAALRDEVDKLTQPPAAYATLLGVNEDGTVDVQAAGRKMRVELSPAVDPEQLTAGAEVVLNEAYNVVMVRDPERSGEIVTIKEVLDEHRALVVGRADEERVAELGSPMAGTRLRAGDSALVDPRSGLLLEEAAQGRGRGAGARGGPRHLL
ncbi:MAG: hypothetical protein V9E94_11070 [Microthrixaceae bacterium]